MVEEVQIQEKKDSIKEQEESIPQKNTERVLKIFGVIIGLFSLFSLIFLKLKNPQFPLVWVIVIGVVIVFVSLLLYFGFTILRVFQSSKEEDKYTGKLPKPVSLGELRKMANMALTNDMYCNHCTECLNERFYHVGKNNSRVYVYKTRALYKTSEMKDGIVYIVINTHYPEELRSILIDPTSTELTKSIIHLSTSQEVEPDFEESMVFNPFTSTYESKKKITHNKEDNKTEEKKEDLE